MSWNASPLRYCPHCEEEQPVVETVPWQEDMCRECMQSIPHQQA